MASGRLARRAFLRISRSGRSTVMMSTARAITPSCANPRMRFVLNAMRQEHLTARGAATFESHFGNDRQIQDSESVQSVPSRQTDSVSGGAIEGLAGNVAVAG